MELLGASRSDARDAAAQILVHLLEARGHGDRGLRVRAASSGLVRVRVRVKVTVQVRVRVRVRVSRVRSPC